MNKKQIIRYCRELRQNETEVEHLLWLNLRGRKVNGLKFLRQHPFIYSSKNHQLNYFIADFYCAEKKLIIELDGKIHLNQVEYDENRDAILYDLGINVVRFKNENWQMAIDYVKNLK